MKYDIIFSTIFKHNPYMIPSWVEYHTGIGVDYFYLFYHGKITDDIKDIESKYNNVTIIEWNIGKYGSGVPNCMNAGHYHSQMAQLWYTLALCGGDTKWIGNFDLDEFLVLKNYNNLKEFLNNYNYQNDIQIQFNCNWAKLNGLTNETLLNFKLSDILNYDTIVKNNSKKEYCGITHDGCFETFPIEHTKYIYSPFCTYTQHNMGLTTEKEVMLTLHKLTGTESIDKKTHFIDINDGHYLHYKGKINKNTNDLVKWHNFHYEDYGNTKIDNTIRKFIKKS